MKTSRLMIWVIAMTVCISVSAQTTFDAAKLYEEELNGTARYVGMGGAMGALGSDPSVISHNPAGIGTYRKSDINASFSVFGTSVNLDPMATQSAPLSANGFTYYSHNTKSDIRSAFDNISIVFSGADMGENYLNFAFSCRRLQNMDRDMDYVDDFIDGENYLRYREFRDHQLNKVTSIDLNLSYNLSDMLYLGWTLGLLTTDTRSDGYFYDYYPQNSHPLYPDGRDYTAVDKMNSAEGKGWNMAAGIILRPVAPIRFGVAVKTPTSFRQTIYYSDCRYAILDNPKDEDVNCSTEYKFTSPWTLDLSLGFTMGHTAFGAEVERHFTQRSSLSVGNIKMASQGAVQLKDYSTIKLGVEQNIKNLSLRAGYNYIESMIKDNEFPVLDDSDFNGWTFDSNNVAVDWGRSDFMADRKGSTQYFTAGLGYCSNPDWDGTQFYFDVAYVHGIRKNTLNLNEFDNDLDLLYNYKSDKVLFTLGWNF